MPRTWAKNNNNNPSGASGRSTGGRSRIKYVDMALRALIPTRTAFDTAAHAGTSFLGRAGFDVRLLAGHPSIFSAVGQGVADLLADGTWSEDDLILLAHDDVHFHGISPLDFTRSLRRHVNMPGAGFVGVAGCRELSQDLVWWRNASGATALAGMVYHGLDVPSASRSFFGPPGRVAVLDGVLLATRLRTLRRVVRLDPPPGLESAWHFYDISWTLQAHMAGLSNVALPLGVYHASVGKPDASWEAARRALATRLRPLLPSAVVDETHKRRHRRVALLGASPSPSLSAQAEARLPGGANASAAVLREAGYEVIGTVPAGMHYFELLDKAVRVQGGGGGGAGGGGGGGGVGGSVAGGGGGLHGFTEVTRALGALSPDDTLLIATPAAQLPLTPPADIEWFVEAALNAGPSRTFASPIGCHAACQGELLPPRARGAGQPATASDAAPDAEDAAAAREGGEEAEDKGQDITASPYADIGIYMTLGDDGVSHLHALSPPRRVGSFAQSGLLFGRWRAFRELHLALADVMRGEALDTLRARKASPEVLYSQLASLLNAEGGDDVDEGDEWSNEVVPIASMLIDSSPMMARCPCA